MICALSTSQKAWFVMVGILSESAQLFNEWAYDNQQSGLSTMLIITHLQVWIIRLIQQEKFKYFKRNS